MVDAYYVSPEAELLAMGAPEDEGGSSSWASSPFAWFGLSSLLGQLLGGPGNTLDTRAIHFFVLGLLIELGRRLAKFALERFQFSAWPLIASTCTSLTLPAELHTTATFEEGDPTYEWIAQFLVCGTDPRSATLH